MKKNIVTIILSVFIGIICQAQEQLENYTYRLSQSNDNYTIWTTLPCNKIFKDDALPGQNGDEVKVYCAKNEFEPFQLIIKPKNTGEQTLKINDFGSGIQTEAYQVEYINITQTSDNLGRTGANPDPLMPIENNRNVQLRANENNAFWFLVHVPESVPSGDYTTHISIAGIEIPVKLHVFNFAIDKQPNVKSQMNYSHQNFLQKYSVPGTKEEYWFYVDKIKKFFLDHRLTPKSALWPGGLTSGGGACFINYDCNGNLSDPHGIWGFEHPADKYLNGNGFNNGTGFPSFMAITFKNNDASVDQRPADFCDITRTANDWYQADNYNTAYNQKWRDYMRAIENYLTEKNYLDKAYYYFANEPNNQAAFNAVAWYANMLKQAAPKLKLMVSEEPRPEIYNKLDANSKIDIWLPVLQNYNPEVSHERELKHNETSWIYFLHSTRPPFFNPITIDHQGIEGKLTGWLLWKYRIKGIAYYSLNNWSVNPWTNPLAGTSHNGDKSMLYPPAKDNSNIAYGANNHRLVPSLRFEMLRDGLEDYEYFYQLNNKQQPEVEVENPADYQVNKIISGLSSYTRDASFMYNLRRVIGLYLGGEISQIPDLKIPSTGTPGNYYINFQDPNGEPTADPLVIEGKEYQKIGINPYDAQKGYGWFGNTEHFKTYYDEWADADELKKSYVYDDYAHHPNTFQYDLPNGNYNVTVCIGRPRKSSEHNKLIVEGITLIDDETAENLITRQTQVTVNDNNLTLEVGIFDYYTFLCYMHIEAIATGKKVLPALKNYSIYPCYPNPASTYTNFSFQCNKQEKLTISVYNCYGKKIATPVQSVFQSGYHQIQWQIPIKLINGIYFCVIENADKATTVQKLIISKK